MEFLSLARGLLHVPRAAIGTVRMPRPQTLIPLRGFRSAIPLQVKQMPPRPTVNEDDIEESFLKGSGPGGQKIVRPPSPARAFPVCTDPPSRVRRVREGGCFGAYYVRQVQLLTTFLSQNKTASAVQLKHLPTGIVVKSQATRSRTQNRKIARLELAERLEVLEKGPDSRRAVVADVHRKRKASKTKKAKRKYKQLDEQKALERAERPEGVDEGESLPRGNGRNGNLVNDAPSSPKT